MRIVLDMHCHTVASGHASGTLEEFLLAAKKRGLELTGTAEHAPDMPGTCPLSYFEELIALPSRIKGMDWMAGVEANIIGYDGALDMPEDVLSRLGFVIASLHPCCLDASDRDKNTQALVAAMRNPHVDIIGHIGDAMVPINIEAIVSAAKETGTLLEFNNLSLRPGHGRFDGGEVMKQVLALCKRQSLSIILGSDAHAVHEVGDLKRIIRFVEDENFPEDLIVNTSVAKFKNALKS